MPLTEAGDRIDRRLGSFAIRPVVDDDTHRLVRRALELLSREHGAMTPREVVEVGADDETDMLEAHPIDALMKRRNQLDELDRRRLGESNGSPSRSLEIGRPFQTFSRLATDRSSNSSRRTRYSRQVRVLTARWLTGSAPASIPSSEQRSTCRR